MSGDRFALMAEDLRGPAEMAETITPSANPLPHITKRIWVGGAGNVTLTTKGGTSVTYSAVPAGTYLQVRAVAVTAATATNLIAEY
jgi:hypothetical protein